MFSQRLNQFMTEANITVKELSEASGIPMSTISRYRNGKRTPRDDCDYIRKIAEAIVVIQRKDAKYLLDFETVYLSLLSSLKTYKKYDYDMFSQRMDILLDTLNVNASDLARQIHYSSAHISMIRKGKRRPRQPFLLIRQTVKYISRTFADVSSQKKVSDLIGFPDSVFKDTDEYNDAMTFWLIGGERGPSLKNRDYASQGGLTESKNITDINRKARNVNKTYMGRDGLKAGIRDFFKELYAAGISSVIVYCDFSQEEMPEKDDFIEFFEACLSRYRIQKVMMIGTDWQESASEGISLNTIQNSTTKENKRNIFAHIVLIASHIILSAVTVKNSIEYVFCNLFNDTDLVMHYKKSLEEMIKNKDSE